MLQQKIMKENNLVQQGIAIISEAKACQYIHLFLSVASQLQKEMVIYFTRGYINW